MKGYIPIEIPTKRYIKAYVIAQLGDNPMMSTRDNIGSKFYDLLQHETNEERSRFSNVRYNAHLKLYVSYHTFYHRGAFLNETNIKNFNNFLEKEIKWKLRHFMDFYIEMHPNFMHNLPAVRKKIGIDIDDWDSDSIKKDYYRYRLKNKLPLLYKNEDNAMPFSRQMNTAF